jgi:dethiobiotin synthetase
MNGIFITGTDTNVGKTWVGAQLISVLCNKKSNLILRKPIESGWDESNVEKTDAYILAKAANKLDEINTICPNHLSQAISPVRAAKLENKSLSIAVVKEQCINEVEADSFLYVEGAGGFYSPLCADGLNADLASSLNLPLILVAENRLGCINQVLLNIEAIKYRGLELKAIVLNDTSSSNDCCGMNNAEDLIDMLDCPVITSSFNDKSTDVFEKLATLISTS